MIRKLIYAAVAVTIILGIIQGCSKNPENNKPGTTNTGFDRKGMLTNLSTNIIIPAYTAFQTDAAALDAAVTAFTASPDDTHLAAVQVAFITAYKQWQATSVFEIGPAEQVQLRVNTNTYPADIGQINANITSNTYNPVLLANLAAKGLPAMDYLLFGIGADNTAIIAQYTTDSQAANRKTYLAKLSAELKANATTVLTGWNGAYKATFIAADGTDEGSSAGQLVNQLAYDYEILKNYEIGVPAGVQSMGTIFPQKVQAYYSKISAQLALLHIQAIENIYAGISAQGDGLGLDDYLIQVNAKFSDGSSLNTAIKNQFGTATTKLQSLTDPLSANIMSNDAAVTATYTELQKLTVMLKTDMPSSLGILITYGDNDGD